MTNGAIVIEWGMPRQGREQKALEVFFSSMQKWEAWKSAGRIASFQPFGTLTGDYDKRSGFVLVQGTNQQIEALHQAEDYRQLVVEIINIATHVNVTMCETGDAMATRMQRYGGSIKSMGL
jgi:hypothetical protein